jgi:hypothetical protein
MWLKAVSFCGSFEEHEGDLITLAWWRGIAGVKKENQFYIGNDFINLKYIIYIDIYINTGVCVYRYLIYLFL